MVDELRSSADEACVGNPERWTGGPNSGRRLEVGMPSMVGEKDTIICDLDGTIALDEARAVQYLRKPHAEHCACNPKNTMEGYDPLCTCGWKRDWDGYFAACESDEPNWPVIHTIRLFWDEGYNIRLLTGRNESVRDITERWLRTHAVPHHTLLMRPQEERMDDHILKPAIAIKSGWLPQNVLFVLEDRQRVVDSWRKLGYTVFQVAPGNF